MAALRVPWALIVVGATAATAVGIFAEAIGPVLARKEVIKKPCRYDRECARHAYCKLQTECACKDGFFVYKEDTRKSEVCLKQVMGVGDDCLEATQCQLALGTAAECGAAWDGGGGGVCRCTTWAHEVDGRCYNTSRVGERCVTRNNCLLEGGPPLACADGVCVCPRLEHGSTDGMRCLPDRRLGEECYEDEECITTNSHCMGVCECSIHYVADQAHRRCLRVADSVGDMCEEDLQCNRFVADTECSRGGECVCRDGFHAGPQGASCWRTVEMGEVCVEDMQCLLRPQPLPLGYNETLGACQENRCRCAPGFRPDGEGRFCVAAFAGRATPATWALVLMLTAGVVSATALADVRV